MKKLIIFTIIIFILFVSGMVIIDIFILDYNICKIVSLFWGALIGYLLIINFEGVRNK